MKVSLSWQQVGLVAVLLTAIICSHVWAPLAASAVISIASTLVGTFFVNVQKSPDAPPPPAPPTPPAGPKGGAA